MVVMFSKMGGTKMKRIRRVERELEVVVVNR